MCLIGTQLDKMSWHGAAFHSHARLVIIGAGRYQDKILQPAAISYLWSLKVNAILQEDSSHPHSVGIYRRLPLESMVRRIECHASRSDLNIYFNSWNKFGHTVHAEVINTTRVADLWQMVVEDWDAIPLQRDMGTSMRRRRQAGLTMYGFSSTPLRLLCVWCINYIQCMLNAET